jgi:hypothetical protein
MCQGKKKKKEQKRGTHIADLFPRNVFRKNKALAAFKSEDECRVILLSSSKAAAGLNLMEASHVVLIGKEK